MLLKVETVEGEELIHKRVEEQFMPPEGHIIEEDGQEYEVVDSTLEYVEDEYDVYTGEDKVLEKSGRTANVELEYIVVVVEKVNKDL